MQAYNEVTCPLGGHITQTDYGPLSVHVSNYNGTLESSEKILLVYHSDCLDCDVATGCKIKVISYINN